MIVSGSDCAGRLGNGGVTVRMGPFAMKVRTALPDVQRCFVDLYQDYPVCPDEDFVDFEVVLREHRAFGWFGERSCEFMFDGQRQFGLLPRHHASALLEWGLNWCVAQHVNRYILVHAGVVAQGDRAILMPGDSGVGKSTLTAALVFSGWRLLSDELALIDRETGLIHPIPRPISLKNASITKIANLFSEVHIGAQVEETHKGTLALIRPPRESVAQAMTPARVAALFFPRYVAGSPATIEPRSRADAFNSIHESSFNYGLAGRPDFNVVADMIEAARAFEIRYDNLTEAVGAVNRVFEQAS